MDPKEQSCWCYTNIFEFVNKRIIKMMNETNLTFDTLYQKTYYGSWEYHIYLNENREDTIIYRSEK